LLPAGGKVRVARDPGLDDVDRYGRLLRYVFRRGRNVNLLL
jgi:endonuclease YncB( thermonuclease family)